MNSLAPDKQLKCPVDEAQCVWLNEVDVLRKKVAQLADQAMTDELTGLFNYRHLMWALNLEIERAHRSGNGFAVGILDFDDFKKLNDDHGHEFGNQVLRAAGDFLRRSLRKIDIPCRYGGEEFVVVLPGTSLREAVLLNERLRKGIAAMRLNAGELHVPVSVSIGVDFFPAGDSVTAEQVLDRADKYLLLAKQAGKNRVLHPPLEGAAKGMSNDERNALLDVFREQS